MQKIKILDKEFEVGDIVCVDYELSYDYKKAASTWIKIFGEITNIVHSPIKLLEICNVVVSDNAFEKRKICVERIESIKKLVYER